MSERRAIDSIFQARSITTKEAGTSFNTPGKSNNKKRKGIKSFFFSFRIRKQHLQKLSSLCLIITVLFQSMAGLFLFAPQTQASYNDSWYDNNWTYRKQITIDRTKIPHTDTSNTNLYLTDFPILISLTDNDLKSAANNGKVQKEDGSDIIFTLPDKTLLNYEIESYDKITGSLVAWVKVPQLNDVNNSSNTAIYMYYGNSGATGNTAVNTQGVWDGNFKMVQHMNHDPSNVAPQFLDSTSNANNGTSSVGMASNNKIVGANGWGTSFNASNQYVDLGNGNNWNIASAITIDVWINTNSLPPDNATWAGALGKQGSYFIVVDTYPGNSKGYSFGVNASLSGYVHAPGESYDGVGVWKHVVGVYDGSHLLIYVNGSLKGTTSYSSNLPIATNPMRIGNVGGFSYFNGSLDEVRISNTARSSDWIKTEYNNQSDSSSFYTLGTEESYTEYTVPPVVMEVTPVPTPTDDPTPSYTFSSSKGGSITYGGSCASSNAVAVAGNNTVIFNLLSAGVHNDCIITITDAAGNSDTLNISSFTVNTHLTTYIVPAITDNKILPKTSIDSSYVGDTISAQASPGEYKSLSFAVNSNVNLDSFQVESSNLSSLSGKTIPASALDIKAVKVWYQGGYGNDVSGRYLIPELLLKDDSLIKVDGDDWNSCDISNPNGKNSLKVNGAYADISSSTQTNGDSVITPIVSRPIQGSSTLQPVNLSANYNKQFWITLHVPEDTRAGDYAGNIILKGDSDIIKNINLDLKVLPINLLEPSIEYSIYYRGTIKGEGSISSENKTIEQYTAEMEDMKAHGITNPTIYSFGTDNNLIQELSIRLQAGMDNSNMYYVGSISADKIAYYKNLTTPYGVTTVYQYGPDEQSLNNATQRNFISSVHSAGGKYFDAQSVSQADSVADILDLAVVSFRPSIQLAAKYHSYGHKIYSYANPQVVPEYPNAFRKNYGLSLWQADYDGAMDYAYQHSFGDIWNDFDFNVYRDHVFAYPTANGVIDTIQYEGFREGINDMRYLATLQNAITLAKTKGPNTTITEAENYLATLKTSSLENQNLDAVRSNMINYILALQSSTYYLTVNSGTGSDFYKGDSRISISANTIPGLIFDKWTGDIQTLSDVNSSTATVIMPCHAVNLTATYKNDAPWYSSSYIYRRSITIDHNKVSNTDQINFPILISLTDNDLKDISHGGKVQNSNGNDIVFTLPDKTSISYEIEFYDNTIGKLIAWVKVPNLLHLRDNVIYLYYGNSNAISQENKTGVWDDNFKMVQHMNGTDTGTAGDHKDSTVNGNNSTNTANEPVKTGGKIGDGQSFNGNNTYINVGNVQPLGQSFTVEMWHKRLGNGSKTYSTIFGIDTPSWSTTGGFMIFDRHNGNIGARIYNNTDGIEGQSSLETSVPDNIWRHYTVVWNKPNLTVYRDGQYISNVTWNHNIGWNTYSTQIGVWSSSYHDYGVTDEVRISNTARSADWIKTEYNNQSDPSSFYTVSSQQGYMDHISITGNTIQEPSKTQTLTLTAYNINGQIDTTYAGEKNITIQGASREDNLSPAFTDKDNNTINFSTYAPIIFTNGIAHTNITLYKQESANITATDGYTNTNPFFTILVPGNNFTPPTKPQTNNTTITFTNNQFNLTNLPNTIKQIAVSLTNDFIHSSWIAIEDMENILKSYTNTDKLYLKLRTDTGAVSDTITYSPTSNTGTTTIQDGDIVKTPSSPDIYVIKIQNSKKYKRLILSPHVFNSYQHLKWENIKTISEEQLNQYQTSNLVKEATDTIIYTLTPNGDQGQRKPFDITQTYDPDSIYTINKVDRDSYEWEE